MLILIKIFRFIFVFPCVLLISFFGTECLSLELTKGVTHYARDMEYYYQKPRPEILTPLIVNFVKNGVCAKSENRLMLAAFLAELASAGKFDPLPFIDSPELNVRDAKHMLAWTFHLSGMQEEDKLLAKVLRPEEKALIGQIKNSPQRLTDWSLKLDPSVLQMYWSAFMANGNPVYLDKIIRAALQCADPPGTLTKNEYTLCAAAAASLYDFAPRHPAIIERVRASLSNRGEKEKKILYLILREEPGKK